MVNSDCQEKLSIVVPVFNEEETIFLFYDAIQNLRENLSIPFDFYFIDDGSTDSTLSELRRLSEKDNDVHYISFSRNFGKEAAIYAGLVKSDGEYVVVMDVDLQDPPELLPKMLREVRYGDFDAVGTCLLNRKGESKIRSFFSSQFYKWMNKISKTQLVEGARDYRLMSRPVVNAVLSVRENQRFSKGIFSWVGFKVKYIPFESRERTAGKTSWSFLSLSKYAIEGIVSFSTVPLTIVMIIGLVSFSASVLAGIFIVIRALISDTSVAGWPSMVTIILFMGGIQMLSLGVIGRYLSAIYIEDKDRPIYITKEER